jgi:anthranilate phosphoribosyltransferase
MSNAFRELLRKVGSGPHTGEDLSRDQAKAATRMMLLQEATPAQIGAFMIAHRIKRPTGAELAGMLDAYQELGPSLQPIESAYPVTVMCLPYDGRSRTAPISPLTALILTSVGVSVILHGGDRMPTKEGVPLIELWQELGVHWERLSLAQVQHVLETTGLGFVYLTHHFPLASGLVTYRDQIGKRPPFATLELMWSPYAGEAHVVCGFVHPPTENMFRDAFARRGTTNFTTVKGLEGSCDLPRDRTAIIGIHKSEFERRNLVPRDYGFAAKDSPLTSTQEWSEMVQSVLEGKPSELTQAAIWNGGFYLWCCGVCPDLTAGLAKAEAVLTQGIAAQKLGQICNVVESLATVKS